MTTDGVVIRERSIGETDRFIDVLTADNGVIEISVKGVKRSSSKYAGATQMLTYGKFCVMKKGERYYLNSAQSIDTFYGLRLDLVRLSLAMYFADVIKFAVSSEQPAEDILHLFVNALYLLANGRRSEPFIKTVFELRLLAKLGFMPNLVACDVCACYEHNVMLFLPVKGIIVCGDCYHPDDARETAVYALSPSMLHAMRYIIYSELSSLFNFKLSIMSLRELSIITESYLLIQLDRGFKTLDFYKSMVNDLEGGTIE